jgi:hypothetical protein
MWTQLKKLLHDILTENDGVSYCPVRVLGVGLSVVAFPVFGYVAVAGAMHGHFDLREYGETFAIMLGGIGVLGGGVAIKAKTDTDANNTI